MNKKSKAGGFRQGSGRPKGSGKYGELTQPVRVPLSLISEVKALLKKKSPASFLEDQTATLYHYPRIENLPSPQIPLYSTRVAAGLPIPVDDHIERHLDLNQYLVQRPSTTFLVRVEGESMIEAGIYENDILVVDSSLEPTSGRIIIAVVNGELTVKRLRLSADALWLMPENPRYQPIQITEEIDFRIWGIVVHVIHSL